MLHNGKRRDNLGCKQYAYWACISKEVKVTFAHACLTLCNPVDYTVHGILQARTLMWVAFPISRGSSQPRDRTLASHIAGGYFTSWATRKAHIQSGCKKLVCITFPFYSLQNFKGCICVSPYTSNVEALHPNVVVLQSGDSRRWLS